MINLKRSWEGGAFRLGAGIAPMRFVSNRLLTLIFPLFFLFRFLSCAPMSKNQSENVFQFPFSSPWGKIFFFLNRLTGRQEGHSFPFPLNSKKRRMLELTSETVRRQIGRIKRIDCNQNLDDHFSLLIITACIASSWRLSKNFS